MLEINEVLQKLENEISDRKECNCSECFVFNMHFRTAFESAIKAIRSQNDLIQDLQQNNADEYFPKPPPITVDEDDIPF